MSLLLSVTFACGVIIAFAHVVNRRFVAPVYDVALNLLAFTAATAASLMLDHWLPATLSSLAIICWLVLGRRTLQARGVRSALIGEDHRHDRQRAVPDHRAGPPQ